MKDNDFLSDKLKISIGEEAKEKLLETLAADVEFLTRLVFLIFILCRLRLKGFNAFLL
jgi:1-phosphatidylinositol-5-phosphate 4-kinase